MLPGGWRSYPEKGCGASLWTTPTDLARFGIEMMRAHNRQSNRLLRPDLAQAMLTRQTPDGKGYGLGFGVAEEGTEYFHFSHDGANAGFRSFLVMYPALGRGAVIMTNGEAGDALWREILNAISVEYALVRDDTVEATIAALVLATALRLAWLRWRRKRRFSSPGVE